MWLYKKKISTFIENTEGIDSRNLHPKDFNLYKLHTTSEFAIINT